MPEIYTIKELAEFMKIDPVTLRRMARKGEIPAFKVGSEYRFTDQDVATFIEANRVAKEVKA